jgi:hypothetical protein
MKVISGGKEIEVDHERAERIARSVMQRPNVTEILASGDNLTADNERIILAQAYLDLLIKKRPWEKS